MEKMKLFVTGNTEIENIIIVKVDMTRQKGWVWNDNDEEKKVEFNLFEDVVLGIGVAGSENKVVTVTKVTIE